MRPYTGLFAPTILLSALLLLQVRAAPVYPLPLPNFNFTGDNGVNPPSPAGGGGATVPAGGNQAGYVWTSRGTYETFDKECVLTTERPFPVVLLPGLMSPGLVTTRYMAHRLQDAGYCVYQVMTITGASQVDLVGHAEGSLVSLWYMRKLGGEKNVNTLTSIAPPFHGTTLRGLTTILKGLNFYDTLATLTDQLCPACTQVVESSAFLQELRTKERNPPTTQPAPAPKGPQDGGVKYLVVMTAKDEVITPWTSGYLDDVEGGDEEGKVTHLVVEDICEYGVGTSFRHLGIMFSPLVFAMVDGFLTPRDARPRLDCQSS
ncbi:hypothetical protein BGZ89_008110 [Linnemannia elongata]|nr:hypothetical protein BGZ89_008110 [Linnemannia elongata]